MRTFRSPVAGLSLRRFAFLFLSFSRSRRPLALSLAPPPSPSDQRARVRALCSPGCSLALSHPQCAHRTRPGRKSFPLRVARTTHVFRLSRSTSRSTGDRRPRTARISLWIEHRSSIRSIVLPSRSLQSSREYVSSRVSLSLSRKRAWIECGACIEE